MTNEVPATVHRVWAADLDTRTLYELLRLRMEVFVVEQAAAFEELDGRDLESRTRHYWLGGPGHPEPVLGYVRLLKEAGGEYRIERLCTARSVRGHGLGRRLMVAALGEVADSPCGLNAQEHLVGFFRSFGFVPSGPSYDWDGVAHVPLRRDGRG